MDEKWVAKNVEFKDEDFDSFEPSSISEKVKAIIQESEIPSLQILINDDRKEEARQMLRDYWMK